MSSCESKFKYLICIPRGGINNMLSRIDLCYTHCLKYGRILVIDSSKSWFKDDIRDYINFNSPIIYKDNLNELYDKLNNESTYPPEFKGELNNINNFKYSKAGYTYNDKIIDNDLFNDYSETVKVHLSCGDGNPINLMKICSFKPIILNVFRERYNQLPKDYISVHIRNTDKKSNIGKFLEKYKNKIKDKPIFLGTDHAPTINNFRELFGSNIYSFANIPDNNGMNIHYNHSLVPTNEFNVDCLVDLLLLAAGAVLYLSHVIKYNESGYGRLAMTIHNDKDLFRQLTA